MKIRITTGFSKEKMIIRANLPKVIVDGVHHVDLALPMDSIEQSKPSEGTIKKPGSLHGPGLSPD